MANDLMTAIPDSRSWKWVMDSFRQSRSSEFPCALNLTDTVLLESGRPTAWFFTGRAGNVLRKSGAKLTWSLIKKSILRSALSFSRNSAGPRCAAVVHCSNSSLAFVEADSFDSYLAKQLPTSAYAIQSFVEPRGDFEAALASGNFANFRTVMSLDRTGRHSTQCYRLGAPTGFNATQKRDVEAFRDALVRSMDVSVNKPLEAQTMALVRTLEGVRRCRVRKMVCDWVVDCNGTPWFVQSREVLTVSGKNKREARQAREAAQRSSKRQRTQNSQNFLSISGGGKISSSSSSLPSVNMGSGENRGVASQERAMSPNTLKAYQRLAAKKKREQESMLHKARLSMAKPVNPPPGGMNDRGMPLQGVARTALGTSQAAGCPGDFCEFTIALNDQGKLATGGDGAPDGSQTDRSGLSTREKYGVIARLRNETLVNKNKNLLSHQEGGSKGGLRTGNKKLHDLHGERCYRVPYYWVPRARAERVLVTLMLRRYAAGENGDYLSTLDNTHEMSDVLGANYPAHFYKDVDVCENCMKIYGLIDDARDAAMAKMERKMHNKSNAGMSRENVWDEKAPPIQDRWAHASGAASDAPISAKEQGMARAEAAIACLTKGDISEMRSFNNPAPAVQMVAKAVMLLLTGEPNMSWKKSRRLMANGDRFFGMLTRSVRAVGNEKG